VQPGEATAGLRAVEPQKVAPGKPDFARPCKKGGWTTFTNPNFKQGQCVKFLVHGRNTARKGA